MDKISTIQIHASIKDRLAEHGKKGNTYEEIIIKLMDYWDETH